MSAVNSYVALNLIGLSPHATTLLLEQFQDPDHLFAVGERLHSLAGINRKILQALSNPPWDEAAAEVDRAQALGIAILTLEDPRYPALLRQIYDPPAILYVWGDVGALSDGILLTIVGARYASSYGLEATQFICQGLTQAGMTLVSGGARGVDTMVHRTALEQGGKTICVFGAGLECPYPAENKKLFEKIRSQGALVSEFPLKRPPYRSNFPQRNRVISGLSRGVVITEAAMKSGSLITGKCALEQNRELFALPGGIQFQKSQGTNYLIQQGAKLVLQPSDILEEFNIKPVSPRKRIPLSEQAQAFLNYLEEVPQSSDELSQRSGLPISEVLATLSILEMGEWVKNSGGRYYKRL